jgi:hypothetical protein
LQKTGGFARNWPLASAKFASMWLPGMSLIAPAHFPNQISNGRKLNRNEANELKLNPSQRIFMKSVKFAMLNLINV